MVQAVEPENSLDAATAAVAAVTAPVDSNISPGSQRRRNIHSSHVQHPTISKETDSIHSRTFPMSPHFRGLRRQTSRTFSTNKSDTTIPNLHRTQQHARTSAYPTPARSDISKDSKSYGRSHHYGRKVSTAAKLESPSPSISPAPQVIYDTIEVMLAPPPELLAVQPPKGSKRTDPKNNSIRRSKRRKLDNDDAAMSMEVESAVLEKPSSPLNDVENAGSIPQPTNDADLPTEQMQLEEDVSQITEAVLEATEAVPEATEAVPGATEPVHEVKELEIVQDVPMDDSREKEPSTIDPMDLQTTRFSQRPPSPPPVDAPMSPPADEVTAQTYQPSTPPPLETNDPLSAPNSAGKSHHSEDINDWLMTDVEPSVDDEPSLVNVSTSTEEAIHESKSDVEEAIISTAPESVPDPLSIIANITPVDSPLHEPQDAHERSTPIHDVNDQDINDQDVNDHDINDLIEPMPDEHRHESEQPIDSDAETPYPREIHADPVATLIDEARMSLSGSVVESPSPPLRTLLPRPIAPRPLKITIISNLGPSVTRSLSESSRPVESESGEFQETPEEFARSTMAMRSIPSTSKQASPAPYPKFDVPELRSTRSMRHMKQSVVIPKRLMPRARELSTSAVPSATSSPVSSSVSLPTPPAQSPPPQPRPMSPSFGLRTTPRPVGRPPPRPNRGGLRHVDHDVDARAKLLMARPKTAIPTHIEPTQYARECIEAAAFCRLPPYNLDPAEHRLFRTHINHVQVTTYLNIRNGILRLWMLNPTIAVCREEALGVAKEDRHLELAAKCHEFLVRHGYINFGCILPPRPLGRPALDPANETQKEKPMKRRKRVLIVGAGAAGLACARQLENLFIQFADRFPRNEELPEVVILEGRNRIGGRIYSHPIALPTVPDRPASSLTSNSKTSTLSSVSSISRVSTSSLANASLQRLPDPAVDLGAQIVTGFDNGNPLAPIVKRQLRLRWHHLHDDSLLFNDQDGVRVDKDEDIRAEKLFNDILDRASLFKEKMKDHPLIEGDRELMDQGKEPHGESGRQIAKVEENEAVLPPMPLSPPLSATRDSPSHSSPKPPKRLRVPARRALTKMGFKLRDGEIRPSQVDIDSASNSATLGETMKKILFDIQGLVDLSPTDFKLLNWHWANLEYGNATNLNKLSLKHWDQDDGNEFLGAHAMILGGFGQFANGLATYPTTLHVRYDHIVNTISYSRTRNRRTPELDEPAVTVTCDNKETIQADAVVVTSSLGVLKSGSIRFEPDLPERKTSAISRLGFGLLNKVVLVYDRPFWDSEADFIGCLRTPHEGDLSVQDTYEKGRGRFYLIWNCTPSCGRPTLVALMAGDAAFQTEEESNETLVNEMTAILARIHRKESLPRPIQAIVSRWRQDPFARGSYSFIGPDATGKDYDTLGEPVDQTVFFAGEATCRTHPATVHGAYMSGLRAAAEVLESIIGKIELPPDDILITKKSQPIRNPLIGKSGIPEVRKRTDPESRRYKARNVRRTRFSEVVEECAARIIRELGPKPAPPKKYHPNAFLLFQKDKWSLAKDRANLLKSGDNPEFGEASRDEVRASMGRMWKALPEDEKKWYNDAVEREKAQYRDEVATFDERLHKWESAVAKIKEEIKEKMDKVELTDEERELVMAAREEERLEAAAKEEKENLKRFYGEVGMDDLFSDEEEDRAEDLYLQSDDVVLDHLLKNIGLEK